MKYFDPKMKWHVLTQKWAQMTFFDPKTGFSQFSTKISSFKSYWTKLFFKRWHRPQHVHSHWRTGRHNRPRPLFSHDKPRRVRSQARQGRAWQWRSMLPDYLRTRATYATKVEKGKFHGLSVYFGVCSSARDYWKIRKLFVHAVHFCENRMIII